MSDAGQGITKDGFLAVIWTLAGVTTVLLAGRLLIRSILVKSFHLEDTFSFLSWLLMIAATICATLQAPLSYRFTSILIGETPMPPETDIEYMTIELRRWNVASQMLFWTSLYCVKISFMFFYRNVMGNSRMYRRVWLVALIYIICCYAISLMGVFGQCGDVRNLWTYAQCNTPYVAAFQAKALWVVYAFHISSDFVVAFLPLPVIWSWNLGLSQKLAVSGIGCLAIITVAFETVRSVKLYQVDLHRTNLYSYLELLISVLIGMLPSFRFMVGLSDKDREYRRIFWTHVTLRSNHSNSSGYSMPRYDHSPRAVQPSQAPPTLPTSAAETV